ncbi:MAG: RtcB family protein, partial [Casimicrobium sp.]
MKNYNEIQTENNVPIKMWTKGVPVEDDAQKQLINASKLPIVFKHIAAMPDVHLGVGATVGSVIPTLRAIIPAAVGVDIGCGMIACKTTLTANALPDNLAPLRDAIERAVPHGRVAQRGRRDPGAWDTPPDEADAAWATLAEGFDEITEIEPRLKNTNNR